MEIKSYGYMALGRGDNFVKNGEFVVTGYDQLMAAASEFIRHLGGKPQEVDTGFMGIKGPLLLDAKDSEIDHQRCGYPRIIKFKLDSRQDGDIAKLLYSFDHIDVMEMQSALQRP